MHEMPYSNTEDFVFRLEPGIGGWTARVLSSPAGEGSGPFRLGIDPEDCLRRWILEADRIRSARHLEAMSLEAVPVFHLDRLSEALFRALFPEPIRRLWERSLGEAAPGGLRIQLRFDPGQQGVAPLLGLPWEIIRDPESKKPWGLSTLTPIVRYPEVSQSLRKRELPRPLRILAAAACPSDTPSLQLEEEIKNLREALDPEDSIELEIIRKARLEDLRQALCDQEIHVLHFMGHGEFQTQSGEGFLLFEKSDKTSDRVSGADLAVKLSDQPSLRLIVLNSCHGGAVRGDSGRDPFAGAAAALIRAGLPAVVAMQLPISDRAAIAFSRALYVRLARGDSIERAVVEGRQAIHTEERRSYEWAIPALFSRLRDGRLFNSQGGPSEAAETIQSPTESVQEIAEPQTAEQIAESVRDILRKTVGDKVGDSQTSHLFRRILESGHSNIAESVLIDALRRPSFDDVAQTAARFITQFRLFSVETAEALDQARRRDVSPWPVQRALRDLAAYDADLLPHPRTALRQVLRRDSDLDSRWRENRYLRRIGILVYGGLAEDGRFAPELMDYEAQALTHAILETLEDEISDTSLIRQLIIKMQRLCRAADRQTRCDAGMALIALEVSPPPAVLYEIQPDLERRRDGLSTIRTSVSDFGPGLTEFARKAPAEHRDTIIQHVLASVPMNPAEPLKLLDIARDLPTEERIPWLTESWRRILHSEHRDPCYNSAVFLDTQGGLLAECPRALASSLAGAILSPDALESSAEAGFPIIFSTLDALGSLPTAFDFVAGWSLVCLRPLLTEESLLPEALVSAFGFSDRFHAKSDTVSRLLSRDDPRLETLHDPRPDDALLEMVDAVKDPVLRFRGYRRLALRWLRQRRRLLTDRLSRQRILLSSAAAAVAAIKDPAVRRWAQTESARLISNLAGLDKNESSRRLRDIERHRLLIESGIEEIGGPSAFIVCRRLIDEAQGNFGNQTTGSQATGTDSFPVENLTLALGFPVAEIGYEAADRLARSWVDLRITRPSEAVSIRWKLAALEHDDVDALTTWASILRDGDPKSKKAAEAILAEMHTIQHHAWPTIEQILSKGVPRARRAILRSLTFLAARRRIPDQVWINLVPALSDLAGQGIVRGETFLLDGPGAVIAAAGAVRQHLDQSNHLRAQVEAAERAYLRCRTSWEEALLEPQEVLYKTLADIGAERLISERSKADLEQAARRVAGEPQVFKILLAWASERMRIDVRHLDQDDFLLGDLLSLLSQVAPELFDVYQETIAALPLWERQLCDAVVDADWYPARQAAIELIGLIPTTTARMREAIETATNDVEAVRIAALEMIQRNPDTFEVEDEEDTDTLRFGR